MGGVGIIGVEVVWGLLRWGWCGDFWGGGGVGNCGSEEEVNGTIFFNLFVIDYLKCTISSTF